MVLTPLKRGFRVLLNPEKESKGLNGKIFEVVVKDYLLILVSVAIIAGIINFTYSLLRALYLDLFLDIDIQYVRMINYSLGNAIALSFFYVFAGTFLIFFLSMILRPFFRKIKYVDLFKVLFYALTPVLLFSWLQFNPVPLFIWSTILFLIAIRNYEKEKTNKGSIDQRD